jgi:uncharacterized membrane protein YhaH (DUF805 family)
MDNSLSLHDLQKLFLSFEGTIGRRLFWIGSIAIALALAMLDAIIKRKFGGAVAATSSLLMGILAAYPWSCLATKRSHDRGRAPYWGVGLVFGLLVTGLAVSFLGLWLHVHIPVLLAILKLSTGVLWLIMLIDLGILGSGNGMAHIPHATRALHTIRH